MRTGLLLLYILLSFNISFGQTKFSEFLKYVNSLTSSKKAAAVDSFMTLAATTGIPVIEDTTVYFLYRGKSQYVFVAGDFNEWDGYFTFMLKVPGTNLQYLRWDLPKDARTLYMIKEKEGSWQKDDYNPKYVSNGGSLLFSILEMPNYLEPWETKYYEGTPQGKIESFSFVSTIMNDKYETHIYLPPGYDENNPKKYPTAYFQDGKTLLDENAANVLDNLIYNHSIEPVIGVFIDPNDRNEEYAYSKRFNYADFVTSELVPYIDQNYNTLKDSAQRLIAGVSYGGTISGYISYFHPDVFTNCGLLSAVIYVNNSELYSNILNNEKEDIRFFAIWGTYEGVLPNYLRNFRKLTLEKGYEFNWAQYNEGHNFGFWRAHIDDLLINFFPAQSVTSINNTEMPKDYFLMQNYPNPFNPATTITFTIKSQPRHSPYQGEGVSEGLVNLTVFDILGKEVTTLVNEYKPAGNYKIEFNASGLPSGVYFYTLSTGKFSQTKKMILLK